MLNISFVSPFTEISTRHPKRYVSVCCRKLYATFHIIYMHCRFTYSTRVMFYSIDSIKFAYDIWVCKFRMELIVTFKFRLFLNVSMNVTHSVIHVQVGEQTNSIDDFVYILDELC